MLRKNLLEWQWSDYAAKHQQRDNLVMHIVAVPIFWLGAMLLLYAAFYRSGVLALMAVVAMVVSLVAQARGHGMESEDPEPFEGALDFPARFVVEQFVTFPRYVISGGWYRALMKSL
jgi:hypothetical protein